MPYCPKCKAEYQDDVNTCTDCGVELVDALPEDFDPEADANYVKIYTLPGDVYAQMVKEALHNEGITCILKGDVVGSSLLVHGSEGTQTDVYVQQKDQERAKEILHHMVDHI